jgi:hypothetical protein
MTRFRSDADPMTEATNVAHGIGSNRFKGVVKEREPAQRSLQPAELPVLVAGDARSDGEMEIRTRPAPWAQKRDLNS